MAWIQNVKRSRSKRAGEGGDAKQGVGKKGWSASSRDRVRTALHKNVLTQCGPCHRGNGQECKIIAREHFTVPGISRTVPHVIICNT